MFAATNQRCCWPPLLPSLLPSLADVARPMEANLVTLTKPWLLVSAENFRSLDVVVSGGFSPSGVRFGRGDPR